jgi:hypothetical protein
MNSREFRRHCGTLFPAILAALLVTGAGCRLARPKHDSIAQTRGQTQVAANQNQVRLRMRALVQPMCGELEQAADAIIAGTTNRAVQQAALRWKIEGVPALREALFQPDPFTAVLDTWVLCNQMADYFESGQGKELLGEASAQAVATCRHMEEDLSQIADAGSASGNASKVRSFAGKWAAEHPIQHSISGRESALSRALERDIADSFSVGEAVTEITTTVDDLNRKLGIYSDQLFRQARWEAELFKIELLKEWPADQAMPLAERAVKSAEEAVATVERLAPGVERAAGVIQDARKLADFEREAAVQDVQAELRRSIEIIQAERLAALKQLHESLAEERKALTRDVEQISFKAVDHAMTRLQRLAAAVLAVVIVTAFLGLFLVRLIFFRRPLELRHEHHSNPPSHA